MNELDTTFQIHILLILTHSQVDLKKDAMKYLILNKKIHGININR